MDKKQLQDILSQPFEYEKWLKVVVAIFGVRNLHQQPIPITLP